MSTRILRTQENIFQPVSDHPVAVDSAYAQLKTLFDDNHISGSLTLFAKPVVTQDNHIEWYTDISDQPIALPNIPEAEQDKVRKVIMDKGNAILAAAERLPHDDPNRKIIEESLLFPSENNIFVMNGQPVITAWAHKPNDSVPLSITNFAPQAPIIETNEGDDNKKRGWLWLLWLLLLLLLLLAALFWWFRPCHYVPFSIPYICPIESVDITFSVPEVMDARADTIITSDIIQIGDIPDKTAISLTGFKNPEYRICTDGSTSEQCDKTVRSNWSNESGILNKNESIQIRLQSAPGEEETHRAYLTIGNGSDQWDVTTEKLLHGICGGATDLAFETKDELQEAGLCESNNPADSVFDTDTGWTWTCPPTSEHGETATCNAKRTEIKHGICGAAHEQAYEIVEDLNQDKLCESEKLATPIVDTDDGWTWTCPPMSEKNGDTATCHAARAEIEQGACGSADKNEFKTIDDLQKSELCTSSAEAATPSETDEGWNWACPSPSVNGTEAQCSAIRKKEPPPPPPPAQETQSEFDRRVNRDGGKKGEVQVTLLWDSHNDLDVHVYCPGGRHIWYKAKQGCRGVLDIDANANSGLFQRYVPPTNSPVENVTWVNGAPSGTYKVYVKHYEHRGGQEPTRYRVRVRVKDKEQVYSGTVSRGQSKHIGNFIVP